MMICYLILEQYISSDDHPNGKSSFVMQMTLICGSSQKSIQNHNQVILQILILSWSLDDTGTASHAVIHGSQQLLIILV